ncbi:MAG: hypothetical protein WKF96_16990 [Solirubrobacteraceae bacterium]
MIAALAVAVLASAAAAPAAPNGRGDTTRDPDLLPRPTKIADLFVADTYPADAEHPAVYVDWFCRPPDSNGSPVQSGNKKDCSGDSQAAFNGLADGLGRRSSGKPELLRVGKARDDCVDQAPLENCKTGVPHASAPCSRPDESPYCAFIALKARDIHLGVIVGARDTTKQVGAGVAEADNGKRRSRPRARRIADIAWHACQIHRDDKDSFAPGDGFYDFLFLDQAGLLHQRLTAAVKYINEGKIKTENGWEKGQGCEQGWDVITNDNGWGDARHPLDTQAWGHAKNYDVAQSLVKLTRAASGGPAVTRQDLRFIDSVNKLRPPRGRTTGAVLRVEVTRSTSYLANLKPPPQQCRILGDWAAAQVDSEAPFAALFPLYNHGDSGKGTAPYNSFAQGTFLRQLELIAHPRTERRQTDCPQKGSSPGSPGVPDSAVAPTLPAPSAGTPPPPARVIEPPRVAPRAPDVMSLGASNLTCHSARLNGWVNPHGTPTTYHFEYWKRGEVNAAQASGFGDAGTGTERRQADRVIEGLQRDTGYTAKLMASNSAGRAVSEIFSFTTPRC